MEKEVQIMNLQPKDFNQAMEFAKEGMQLGAFVDNEIALNLYSRYAFYQALLKSTTVLGAYIDKQLVGSLFANFKGGEVTYSLWSHKIYCAIFSKIIKFMGYESSETPYNEANKELLEDFKSKYPHADAELTYFAVKPAIKEKGIGTLLLNELTNRHTGKLIYLFTDSNSTYEFYENRGFEQVGAKQIKIPFNKEEVPLTCYIFAKNLKEIF